MELIRYFCKLTSMPLYVHDNIIHYSLWLHSALDFIIIITELWSVKAKLVGTNLPEKTAFFI